MAVRNPPTVGIERVDSGKPACIERYRSVFLRNKVFLEKDGWSVYGSIPK